LCLACNPRFGLCWRAFPQGLHRCVEENPRSAKREGFERIQAVIQGKKWFGVSYEEYIPPYESDGVHHPGQRYNGFALLERKGPPLFEYRKRKLVPIAESFSLSKGIEPPPVFTIDLPKASGYNNSHWGSAPHATRPVPLTVSICLDFSSAASFSHLESRPAIILAPARTWNLDVGLTMWEQARARAEEIGSVVVWCDGGEGGVSGVAGDGYKEPMQIGQGSWTRTVGLPFPPNNGNTFFILGGQWMAFASVWTMLGAGWGVQALLIGGGSIRGMRHISNLLPALVRRIRERGKITAQSNRRDEERDLLEDN